MWKFYYADTPQAHAAFSIRTLDDTDLCRPRKLQQCSGAQNSAACKKIRRYFNSGVVALLCNLYSLLTGVDSKLESHV